MEAMGIRCWVAEDHPEPGATLSAKIMTAVAESVAMIVLLTESARSSPYVQQEIGMALHASMPVIALVDQSVEMSDLAMLEGVEHIAFDPNDLGASSANLIAGQRHVAQRVGTKSAPASPQPMFKLQLNAQLQLTGGQLLVGMLVVSAIVALIVVAAQANDASGE